MRVVLSGTFLYVRKPNAEISERTENWIADVKFISYDLGDYLHNRMVSRLSTAQGFTMISEESAHTERSLKGV